MAKLWTEPEILQYKPIQSSKLEALYKKANIPATDPEARAEYIHKLIADSLTMFDEDLINSETRVKGRAAGLNLLERFTLIELAHERGEN